MSDTMYVPEHQLRQQANADEAGVTPAGAELHRPGNNDGRPRDKDKAARDRVRCEAPASAIPGTVLGNAAHAADQACGATGPVNRAWPFNPADTSPLGWWRTLPADRLGDTQTLLVSATLDRLGVIRRGDAFIADLRGEVAAAVAVALALMPIGDVTLEVDLAMTAVLRAALAGDAPAALVLAYVLGRADIGHPFATELSASWLNCHRPHSPDRRRFSKAKARLLAAMREREELPAASVGAKA